MGRGVHAQAARGSALTGHYCPRCGWLTGKRQCPHCGAEVRVAVDMDCPRCDGEGQVKPPTPFADVAGGPDYPVCRLCHGTGSIAEADH